MNHEVRNTSSGVGGCTLVPAVLRAGAGSWLAGPGKVSGAPSLCRSPVKGAVREEEGPVLLAFSFGVRS